MMLTDLLDLELLLRLCRSQMQTLQVAQLICIMQIRHLLACCSACCDWDAHLVENASLPCSSACSTRSMCVWASRCVPFNTLARSLHEHVPTQCIADLRVGWEVAVMKTVQGSEAIAWYVSAIQRDLLDVVLTCTTPGHSPSDMCMLIYGRNKSGQAEGLPALQGRCCQRCSGRAPWQHQSLQHQLLQRLPACAGYMMCQT